MIADSALLNQCIIFPYHLANISPVGKAEVLIIADNNMFMNGNAHDLASKYQLPCNGDVLLGWMGIS